MVGIVHSFDIDIATNQYELTVELSTDFHSLSNVLVVKREHLEEKRELEKTLKNVKN